MHYFTYIGWRSGYTVARAVAVDAFGQAWVAGDTTAKQIPTTSDAIQFNQPMAADFATDSCCG